MGTHPIFESDFDCLTGLITIHHVAHTSFDPANSKTWIANVWWFRITQWGTWGRLQDIWRTAEAGKSSSSVYYLWHLTVVRLHWWTHRSFSFSFWQDSIWIFSIQQGVDQGKNLCNAPTSSRYKLEQRKGKWNAVSECPKKQKNVAPNKNHYYLYIILRLFRDLDFFVLENCKSNISVSTFRLFAHRRNYVRVFCRKWY